VRAFAGWLVLIALCGLTGYLQSRWSDQVRAERESLRSAPTDLRGREESWGELRIGRPSGALPIELPEFSPETLPETPSVAQQEGAGQSSEQPAPQTEQPAPTIFEYIVPQGRVLSKICEDFYDSGRSPIPERVARYNGLASPDELRAGQKILLPPWELLFPRREHP